MIQLKGNEMTFNFDREFQSMMQVNDLNTVILLGHLNPDGDAAGLVMGLAHYIKVNYPQYKVMPYLADTLDKGPKKQVKLDKVFNPFEKPDVKEKYAVIVCDTAVLARMIGREYYESAEASIIIDHHAESEAEGISYEDIHPISGFLRDCEDIQLGFTMYEEEENRWRCSFRSDGKWINVNELLQVFGGGGHAAAGVRKRTNDVEKFRQEILERIVAMRKISGQDK